MVGARTSALPRVRNSQGQSKFQRNNRPY
jgi:hypothetical protein